MCVAIIGLLVPVVSCTHSIIIRHVTLIYLSALTYSITIFIFSVRLFVPISFIHKPFTFRDKNSTALGTFSLHPIFGRRDGISIMFISLNFSRTSILSPINKKNLEHKSSNTLYISHVDLGGMQQFLFRISLLFP